MSTDKLDALERLVRLRGSGALSEDEFQAEKKALLEKEAANGDAPASSGPSAEGTAGPFTHASGTNVSDRANTPVWARKKRSHGLVQVVMLIAALFVATLGGTLWFFNRADQTTYSFMATGPANVRDAPNATDGRVVAQLAEGDFITGRVQGSADKQWVEIAEGPFRGRFVWAGNLASEGPDDVSASADGAEASALRASGGNPELGRYMDSNAVTNRPWRAVEMMETKHQGVYGLCANLRFALAFTSTATGAVSDGTLVGGKNFTELYRAGDRYIWSTGRGYYAADFLPNEMIMRDANGNVSAGTDRAMKCTGALDNARRSGPSVGPTSRAVLFTPSGLLDVTNVTRASCEDVIAAKYTLTCAATILNNMPTASSAPSVRRSLVSAQQESSGRCASQARRVGSAGDLIVQQNIGDVYETIAGQAVYGGDVSDAAISLCIREIVSSMSSAGFLSSGGGQAGVAQARPIASRAVREQAARDAQAAALVAENEARRNGG